MQSKNRFITIASIAGLMAFVGDFLVTFVLGFFYPDYNHFTLVMSELGTSQSPVAIWTNLWWIVFGALFIVFAAGLRTTFASEKKSITLVALLIALFGLGAGIGAGLFPMEPGGAETTLAGKLHGIFAGLGFIAISFVPLVSMAIFSRSQDPGMFWLSAGVFILGLASFALFVASEDAVSGAGLMSYAGLWQRLFLLNHYGYLAVISARMIQSSRCSASDWKRKG